MTRVAAICLVLAMVVSPRALAHAFLATSLGIQGARQEAVDSAQHALRLSPRDRLVGTYASLALAQVHFTAGRYSECVTWARSAIEKSPGHLVGHQFLTAALAMDLSRGGMAIRTTNPPVRGTVLKVKFALPGSKRDVEAECRIAWSDRRVGMGLQFEKVESIDQAAIDEFVDQHFFSNRKA